jgi:hypothetical protein
LLGWRNLIGPPAPVVLDAPTLSLALVWASDVPQSAASPSVAIDSRRREITKWGEEMVSSRAGTQGSRNGAPRGGKGARF